MPLWAMLVAVGALRRGVCPRGAAALGSPSTRRALLHCHSGPVPLDSPATYFFKAEGAVGWWPDFTPSGALWLWVVPVPLHSQPFASKQASMCLSLVGSGTAELDGPCEAEHYDPACPLCPSAFIGHMFRGEVTKNFVCSVLSAALTTYTLTRPWQRHSEAAKILQLMCSRTATMQFSCKVIG